MANESNRAPSCINLALGVAAQQTGGEAPTAPQQLISYRGDSHLLTIAPTGAGKGVSSVIPNLLLHEGSAVVFDPKAEVLAVTRRRRLEMGHEVVVLDPFGKTGLAGDSLNPVDLAEYIDPGRPEEAGRMLASLLTDGHKTLHDPFWDTTSVSFLSGLITWLLADASPAERRFSRLFDFFAKNDFGYDLAVMLDTKVVRNRTSYAEFAAFLSLSERETRPSVQASARQHLGIFGSDAVRQATDQTSFDLSALIEGRPITVFIVLDPTKLESHRGLVRLWLGTILLALASRRKMPAHRTLVLVDEAGTLGRMEPILMTAAMLRGYGVTLWTFFQSVSQLESVYGNDAMVLADNCLVQLFAARNGRVAEAYARLLGDVTREDVMALGAHEQFLLIDGGRSRRCRRLSYLQDPLFRGMADPNPFHRREAERSAPVITLPHGPLH